MTRRLALPDHDRLRVVSLAILAGVAAMGALYFGRDFFVPIAIALLFNALLRPVVRRLERVGLPSAAGAAIVVLGFLGIVVGAGFALSAPAQSWLAEAPKSLNLARRKLESVRASVLRISHAAEQVAGGAAPAGAAPAPVPAPQGPGIAARVFGTTTSFITGFVEVLLLVFLLLAAGNLFLRKLMRVVSSGEAAETRTVVHEVEYVIERYVVVSLMIALGQGAVAGLAMWLLGMPHPLLWGVATLFLEMIPYLGATVMVGALTLVAFATFDGVGRIFAVPAVYILISTIQNNVVSPIAYGRNLKLNPVAVLVSVMFWWALWGVPGAFLAVPMVAALKVVADHTNGLGPLGEFLGE